MVEGGQDPTVIGQDKTSLMSPHFNNYKTIHALKKVAPHSILILQYFNNGLQ